MKALLSLVTVAVSCWIAAVSLAEEKPFTRTFVDGARESYHVQVSLRADVHSVSTSTVGTKTYVTPTSPSATASAEWDSTRVVHLSREDIPNIDETISRLSAKCDDPKDPGEDAKRLQQSLAEVCAALGHPSAFEYVEGPDGRVQPTPSDGRIVLGEAGIPILALWLRRALRPSALFPALQFHPGARSQKPIMAPANAKGSETAEWVDTADSSNAVLHVVQELSWPEPPGSGSSSEGKRFPAGKTSFFSDSNTQISLLDGSVVTSTRTASRETKRILDPVAGLPEPPEFSTKLTIVVLIRRIS